MSDDQPTRTGDLGEQPDPVIEPGEPNPGGTDALPENGGRAIPDLPVDENPSLEEKAPDEVKEAVDEGEDTSTTATESGDSDQGQREEESTE